eukprot:3844474-Prymnesium_polylepis.1
MVRWFWAGRQIVASLLLQTEGGLRPVGANRLIRYGPGEDMAHPRTARRQAPSLSSRTSPLRHGKTKLLTRARRMPTHR